MIKKILIYDRNGLSRFLKEGDIVCVNSGIENDVYKVRDKKVICKIVQAGEFKRRYGLILKIVDANNVLVCCASSSATLKFALLDLTKNEMVKFSKRMIVLIDPVVNILYKDTLVNFNVGDKQKIIMDLKSTWEYKELCKNNFIDE